MSGLNKITIERNQKTLLELAGKPGNDICADCKARHPRWASHNLGIFLCMNCASIHRKIGTHITKVKSINMDSWTKDQVETMKYMGNIKSNAIFNPNEIRHPPPPNLMDSERDSELEQYIRSKYEYRRFLDKSALVSSKLGPSRSASSVTSSGSSRSVSSPLIHARTSTSTASIPKPSSHTLPQQRPSPLTSTPSMTQTRSVSQPLSQPQSQSQQPPPSSTSTSANATSGVWADLVSLQAPAANSSLPLQFQAPSVQPLTAQQTSYPGSISSYQTGMGMGVNPFQQQHLASNPFSQQPFSASVLQPSPYTGAMATTPSYAPSTLNQQQQYFTNQTQMQPPMSAPGQQFFQPRPQQGSLQIQVPNPGQPFGSNGAQGNFLTAPPNQSQFMSSSPGQQFLSHSPQPQALSATPQTQMQAPGQFMTPSPQLQMGMGSMGPGMMSATPQGQFLSTTPQPQMQMQMPMQTGYYPMTQSQPQMQMQGQFGGYQGQTQPPFSAGGFSGQQQWGAM
ncbi:UBA domain-containing protein 3 [Hypsizygus marmoreus]|uniref:UBA domain-containing protein 3 n=1 Tax=Hypsizygus marmoreus TaxID=39966 RepID=A0A369J4U5_HYPMA|nr:UBA domain-containing protein 3 [Hypsizygus marmoreus]